MFMKKFNLFKMRRKKRKRKRKKDMRRNNDQKLSLHLKDSCVCIKQSGKCDAFGLCYCSECKSILKSDSTKMACKMAGRLIMFPSWNKDSDM